MARIDEFFQTILNEGASDLHLAEGQKPKMRVSGSIKAFGADTLDGRAMQDLLEEICADDRWAHFQDTGDLDFAYPFKDLARFRANYYRHSNGMGAIFRIIPSEIKSLTDLDLPEVLEDFANLSNGLALVTGPTGSGKSTTLAAIIDHINANSARHILTIEEPIEFVHENKQSIIVQREVGIDVETFGQALIDAGHADCDVILVGEMRDLETISLAISSAETGNVVFGTLHTNSASKTIDRIIDIFPADQQPQIRTMLSESLRGVCSQLLLKKKGGGRIAAHEILLHTPAVANIIREGVGIANKLTSVMLSGKAQGMRLMDDVIEDYLKSNIITGAEAYMKCLDKERFESVRDQQ